MSAIPMPADLPYGANGDGKITERGYLPAVRRSIQLRRPLAIAIAVLSSLAVASSARASAIFNTSDQTSAPLGVTVYFECGIFCSNAWRLAPGAWAARPGKGGSFQIIAWPLTDDAECETSTHPDLESHGYTDFTFNAGFNPPPGQGETQYEWVLFGTSGNVVGKYEIFVDRDSCE